MPRKKVEYKPENGKPWQKFLAKLTTFKTVQVENWTEYQMIGYFADQLKEMLDLDFMQILTYEGEANKHPQVRIMRKLIVALHQQDKNDPYFTKLEYMPCKGEWQPIKVKAYIDWSIKRISKCNHRQVFSLNYLLRDKDVQAFLARYGRVDRSDMLPEDIKAILPVGITTFGELSFYSQSYSLDSAIIEELNKRGIDLCQIT